MKRWKAKSMWEMGFHITPRKNPHMKPYRPISCMGAFHLQRSLSRLGVVRAIVTIFPKDLSQYYYVVPGYVRINLIVDWLGFCKLIGWNFGSQSIVKVSWIIIGNILSAHNLTLAARSPRSTTYVRKHGGFKSCWWQTAGCCQEERIKIGHFHVLWHCLVGRNMQWQPWETIL